jgi:DNA-binding PadR family transcriptional regulator
MLKHGILGLLNYGDKTGYEIMTVFRDSLNHFWTAQTSQIYRELQTMEKNGWISQRHVEQAGKPDKNIFSITEAGRAELLGWLRADNLPKSARDPFLMKTFFRGELPVEENIAYFRACGQERVFPDDGKQATAAAEMYRQAIQNPEKAVYWKLTIEFGRMFERMYRQWCQICVQELESLQQNQKNGTEEKEV